MTENKDKTAGKFAWFCLGSLLGLRGIPKLIHFVYIIVIIALTWLNAYQAPENIDKVMIQRQKKAEVDKRLYKEERDKLRDKVDKLSSTLSDRERHVIRLEKYVKKLEPTPCFVNGEKTCELRFSIRNRGSHYTCKNRN